MSVKYPHLATDGFGRLTFLMAVAADIRRLLRAVPANVSLLATDTASHGRSVRALATSVAFLATTAAGAIEGLARLRTIGLIVTAAYVNNQNASALKENIESLPRLAAVEAGTVIAVTVLSIAALGMVPRVIRRDVVGSGSASSAPSVVVGIPIVSHLVVVARCRRDSR